MIVTVYTRTALAERRERRAMEAAGYRIHETDWEIIRGMRWREKIIDARISVSGKYVWTKIGERAPEDYSI